MMASTPESRAAEAERERIARQQEYAAQAPQRAAARVQEVTEAAKADLDAVIAEAGELPHVRNPMILQRLLMDSTDNLTAELVTFRGSAESAAARADTAAERADKAAASLVTLTRWLICLTIGLAVLTVAVVWLTAVLGVAHAWEPSARPDAPGAPGQLQPGRWAHYWQPFPRARLAQGRIARAR